MNQAILDVLDVILSAGGPQVPVLIEVPLQVAIHSRCQCEQSDVKLALFVQQGLLAILLDDVRTFLAVDHVVLKDLPYLG